MNRDLRDVLRYESVAELIFPVILRLDRSIQKILPTTLDCPIESGNDEKGRKRSSATDSYYGIDGWRIDGGGNK